MTVSFWLFENVAERDARRVQPPKPSPWKVIPWGIFPHVRLCLSTTVRQHYVDICSCHFRATLGGMEGF